VIQGDFLFGRGDLKRKKIEGKTYVTFHPNTIVYAVPVEQASEVMSAKIGIVWHTTYTGSSFETMKASYGVNVNRLKKSKNVWSQDAMLRDVRNATLTKSETEQVNEILSEIGKLFNQIAGSTLRTLEGNPTLAGTIETFNNTYVRKGKSSATPKRTPKNSSGTSTTSTRKKSTPAKPRKARAPRKQSATKSSPSSRTKTKQT
jgi:hypothetical protein